MRAAVERFARRWWTGALGVPGTVLSALARPVSWCWAGAAHVVGGRRAARSMRVEGLTVLSVGNLAVGGTGKTPLASWLARRLDREGRRPAVLVGGHAHDEALLHEARVAPVPVIEDRDRVQAAREALQAGAAVAVLDDGFQHRGLARDLDIVLLAAEDPFPAPVLPAGPYREHVGAIGRADFVVVTRRAATAARSREIAARVEARHPEIVVGGVELAPGGWQLLDGRCADTPGADVLAVCAIGRPRAFAATLERVVGRPAEMVAFEDHHVYTPADIIRLKRTAGDRAIVTTEKDAVKLRAHSGTIGEVYVLTEVVRWDWGEEAFLARVRRAAAGAPVE